MDDDDLIQLFETSPGKVSVRKFLAAMKHTGLRENDTRLAQTMKHIHVIQKEMSHHHGEETPLDILPTDKFKECISENIVIIGKAMRNEFVIPEFDEFKHCMKDLFEKAKINTSGKNADYIPQLARVDSKKRGLSICTVDGQRYSLGDVNVPFCLQSTSKAFNYALAVHDNGQKYVHEYIGQDEIKVNPNSQPMINSGAIVYSSLLRPDIPIADRFDYVTSEYKRMAGDEFVGFSNETYLSEKETADRNCALGYYTLYYSCFPKGFNLLEALEFYFKLCSVEATCDSASVMAATLANGGICPTTGVPILDPEAVRCTLSLMHSGGMYDSGQFAFKVGLPATSGVSGAVMLVVPNTLGLCVWSPPLDEQGNSVVGVEFCEKLVSVCNFHNYDIIQTEGNKKWDPRKRRDDVIAQEVTNLLFGAAHGDMSALYRFFLKGMDMGQGDYDKRTALHLAAADGHLPVVEFLLEKCHVDPSPCDRWGHTPLSEAEEFKHDKIATYLRKWCTKQHDVKPAEKQQPPAYTKVSTNANVPNGHVPQQPTPAQAKKAETKVG